MESGDDECPDHLARSAGQVSGFGRSVVVGGNGSHAAGAPDAARWTNVRSFSVPIVSEILWRQTRVLGQSRQHARADVLGIVKSKFVVGPARTFQRPM